MARRLAAAVGLVVLLAGCGGSKHPGVEPVTQYIDDVNAIQRGLSLPLGDVALGYRQLSTGTRLDTLQPKLEASTATIRKLERRIDALDPPPEAIRLDGILRRFVHGEWLLSKEMALLAGYARDSRAPLARASAAGKTLQASLHASRARKAQAAALEAYAAPLDRVANDLEALHAPPVAEASQRTQVQTYRDVAARARDLATALRRHQSGAKEVRALEVAVASSTSTAAQKARIAAVKRFNRRVARLRDLEAGAQRERTHLEHTL